MYPTEGKETKSNQTEYYQQQYQGKFQPSEEEFRQVIDKDKTFKV